MADRISMLPDDVLCHILSFLPTKVVVATGVISKRWNSLWLLVPTLDFDYPEKSVKRGKIRSNNFIDSIISSRDVNQSIKSFRLRSGLSRRYIVNKWVNAVLPRALEHLHLDLSVRSHYVPPAVFTCRTLVVLKLCGMTVILPYSVSVYLAPLKILKLNCVEFREGPSLMEIFSVCPVHYLKMKQLSSFFGDFARENVSENILPMLVKVDICENHAPLKLESSLQCLVSPLE